MENSKARRVESTSTLARTPETVGGNALGTAKECANSGARLLDASVSALRAPAATLEGLQSQLLSSCTSAWTGALIRGLSGST